MGVRTCIKFYFLFMYTESDILPVLAQVYRVCLVSSLYSNFLPFHWETADICNVLIYVVPLLSLAYISVYLSSAVLYQFTLLIFFPLLTII